jgi:zinc protease
LKAGAQVSEHQLRNGMRVLIAERRADPIVAVLLFYRVGARNETEREAGVSHFLEHMMFKGTPRFGKGVVDRSTAANGGQNNAFTGYDHTAYWFEFASDRWELALDLEADRMAGLLLDEAEFDSEREVVLEELAMGEDDPWRVLGRRVEGALFPRHPYGRPIIGFPDTLRGMTVADMRAYHARFYHPGNATLVVCGDVSQASALKAVRARFGELPAGPSYADSDGWRPPLTGPEGETRLQFDWDDPAHRVCMAWSTACVGTDEDYALDMVVCLLTSGRLSRLQRRLIREEQLAVNVSSSNDARVEGGIFWLFAECRQDADPAALEAALDEELERIASTLPTTAEMRRARELVRSSDAFTGEAVSDLAEELGQFAVDADWRLAFDGGERHDRVTPAAVRDVARRLLRRDRRVVGWCVPREAQA